MTNNITRHIRIFLSIFISFICCAACEQSPNVLRQELQQTYELSDQQAIEIHHLKGELRRLQAIVETVDYSRLMNSRRDMQDLIQYGLEYGASGYAQELARQNRCTLKSGTYVLCNNADTSTIEPTYSLQLTTSKKEDFNQIDQDGDGDPASTDCNDYDSTIHRGANETCGDGIDQNCNGFDEACARINSDQDGDGFDSIASGGNDCHDANKNINPGAKEIPGNCIDENCDGIVKAPPKNCSLNQL